MNSAIPTPTAGGSSSYCGEYYRVESGQDCGTIEQRFGIDLKDLCVFFRSKNSHTFATDRPCSLFLNPEVLANCTNLLADTYYCVEPVGAISSYSGYLNPTSTTSAFKASSFTPLPNIGDPLAKFSSSAPGKRSLIPSSSLRPYLGLGGSPADQLLTRSSKVIPLANGTRLDCAEYGLRDHRVRSPVYIDPILT